MNLRLASLIAAVLLASAARGEMVLTSVSTTLPSIGEGAIIIFELERMFGIHCGLSEEHVGETLRYDAIDSINDFMTTNWPVDLDTHWGLISYGASDFRHAEVLENPHIWIDGVYPGEYADIVVDSNISPPNGFTLYGTNHQITAVDITLHALEITRIDEAVGNDIELSFTVRLLGTVPEPASVVLVIMGLAPCIPHRGRGRRRGSCSR